MNKEKDFRELSSLILIRDIWSSLRKRRKSQILILFILIIVSGGAEILTFSLFVPFLSIIQSPELAYENNLVSQISKAFGILEIDSAIKIITLAFVLTIIFATSIRLINLWASIRIAAGIGSELSQKAYETCLMESYEKHVQRNSSELLSTSGPHISATVLVIRNMLQMFSALIISIAIFGTLLNINATMTLLSSLILIGIYSIISFLLKPRLQRNSKISANYQALRLKLLQEGLGSFRDIILDSSQDIYIKEYRKFDLKSRRLIG